jgi:hypothetical protein
VPDQHALRKLLYRWRDEAIKAGCTIKRIVVGFEAGRDGFWLARRLRAREIEPMSSIPPAFRYPASSDAPRPTGWISDF